MVTLVMVIHILVSIILVIAVLLQVGKGASIGSTFGSSSQTLFGSAGPTTFLTKVTGTCAAVFMLTSLFLTYNASKSRSASVMGNMPAVKSAPAGQKDAPPDQPLTPEPAKQAAPVSK